MALKIPQKITPFLWFDSNAEEAANFYVSVFPNSRVTNVLRFGNAGIEHHGRAPGSVMTVAFELEGQTFTALNGGPMFQLSESFSLAIACDTQDEVDHYWAALSEGGDPACQNCGWLKDRFGLSWQVVPSCLPELLSGGDIGRFDRVMAALLTMQKLDIATLKAAAAS